MCQIDLNYYAVTINGVAATIASAGYAAGTVTLTLQGGSLHHGDIVAVAWNDLRDSRGATMNGQSANIVVR